MPARQQHFIEDAYLVGVTGTVPAGTVLCASADGQSLIVASLANRTATGRRAECIALTAGDANNLAVEAQWVGSVGTVITGLGAGTAGYVRVSDAGFLQRTATLDATVVGRCDADGTAHVCFPLAGMSLGGVAAATPDNSVQARDPDTGGFRGAAHASISTDGNLELANGGAHGVAVDGNIRSDDGGTDASGFLVRVMMQDGTVVTAMRVHSFTGGGPSPEKQIQIGRLAGGGVSAPASVDFEAVSNVLMQAGIEPTSATRAIAQLLKRTESDSPVPGLGGRRYFELGIYTNFVFHGNTSTLENPETALCNGECVAFWGDAAVVPTTNPTAGIVTWVDPTTHDWMARKPDGTTYDLFAAGGNDEANTLVITTSPSGDLDTTGVGTLETASTGATVTIAALKAPATGKAKRIVIANNNADSGTTVLTHGAGGTAANGFSLPGGTDFTINGGDAYVAYYDHTVARFKLAKGA